MDDWPLLKCITGEEGSYILKEVYLGIWGAYIGVNVLFRKVMRYGYFCLVRDDAKEMVCMCHQC